MKEAIARYFIAIVPPAPVFDQALALKKYFRDQYGSKAALNSPPHITLHMPFNWKQKKEPELCKRLTLFSAGRSRFKIRLAGFSCFQPRVIFIRVCDNPVLQEFQRELESFCRRELNLFNAQYQDRPFHPHLTVAFRDLKKVAFEQAWEEFRQRDFEGDFLTDRITLLRHDGKSWQPCEDFLLA